MSVARVHFNGDFILLMSCARGRHTGLNNLAFCGFDRIWAADKKLLLGKRLESCLTTNIIGWMVPTTVGTFHRLGFSAGELEGMFEEVELRLVSLEDVIETQALQERQLDERFKLALYGEKRKGHFESLQEKLEDDHLLMVHQLEERERAVLRERQQAFSEVFQEDLEAYRAQGRIQRECPETALFLSF
ncbi:dysbindin [Ixodes scapularis]